MLVSDVMLLPGSFPVLSGTTLFKVALEEMGKYRLGITCLVDDRSSLLGVLTDGDIRRRLLEDQRPLSALFVDDAIEHAIIKPVTILPNDSLVKAVNLMDTFHIWDLPVVTANGTLAGLLHLHAAIKILLCVPE